MNTNIPVLNHALSLPNVDQLLDQHLIRGLVSQHLNGSHLFCDESTKPQYLSQWVHNQTLIDEIKELSKLLDHKKSKPVLLKGMELIHTTYEDIGFRFMSDIDLLIEKENLRHWELILIERGFTKNSQKTFYANHYKSEWCKKVGDVEVNIELHTKLYFHTLEYIPMTTHSPYEGFYFLTREEQFLHLCYHLAFQHNFTKLYWMFDIYYFLQKHRLDWNVINQKKKNLNISNSVNLVIFCIQNYFGKVHSPPMIKKYPILTRMLTMNFLINPEKNKLRYLFIKFMIKDKKLDSLKYLIYWIPYKLTRIN